MAFQITFGFCQSENGYTEFFSVDEGFIVLGAFLVLKLQVEVTILLWD